jgi:hypothetical protein
VAASAAYAEYTAQLSWAHILGHIRLDHLRGIDDAVEPIFGDKAELQRSGLQLEILVHRALARKNHAKFAATSSLRASHCIIQGLLLC